MSEFIHKVNRIFLNYSAFALLCIFNLIAEYSFAQCSVVAPANGCVNEIITFNKTNSATYTSLNWDFGDGNSSTQSNPFYQYTTTGNFTVTLTLNLAGGGTCVATHSISIHDLPKPDIKISADSRFCFNENELELEDRSKSGTSSGVIQSRLVLWGDGDRTLSTQPSIPTYVTHSYSRIGKFYLDIELVNDKGCKIKTIDSVEILPFYQPSFGIIDKYFPCDTARICLGNDSVPNPAILKSLIWDWGDGKTDSGLAAVFCHIYTQSSTFPLRLIATHVNGCVADTTLNEYINIPDLNLKPSMGDLKQCVGSRFTFIHPQKSDVTYYWRVTDTAEHLIDARVGPVFSAVFNTPGKYYVELRGNSGNCDKFYYDSFDVVGIFPILRVLNSNQCGTEDTVYFNAYLQMHGTDSFEVFWYFGDSLADICTTRVNGTNYNCKYSNQPFARHKYDTQGCYNIKFFVRDLRNGCYWQDELFVTLRKITENDVSYEVKKKCTGRLADYAFRFKVPDCISDVRVNYDSACNPTLFNNLADGKAYEYTCDDSGWVTVGFIMRNGDAKLYLSNDTTDYIIDSAKICELHIWKHRWFRLNPSPIPSFEFNRDSCPPSNTAVTLDVPEQQNVESAFLQWGDGTSSTFIKHKDSVNFGPFLHQYAKSGMFILWLTLTTDSGCYDSYYDTIILGHYSQIWHDPILCPGKPIELVDAIRYFDDTLFWWRVPSHRLNGIETMIWDLADGNGFSWDKPLPTVTYHSPGIYPVKLATKDKNGCRDTLVQNISVTNIVAGIKPITKKIICDDIIQLFDSSDLKKYEGLDSIKEYFWDFGDGKNPSYLKNPFHYYSSYGNFTITHSVITASGCADTVSTSIFIGGPIPDFKIKDTIGCAPFKAEFINESQSVSKYIWYYGDVSNSTYSTSKDTNVQFTYLDPGVYNIYLFGSDSIVNPDNQNQVYYCSGWFPDTSRLNPPVRRVIVLPKPEVDFDVPEIACLKEALDLVSDADPKYSRFNWRIENDSFSTNSPDTFYYFPSTGTYRIWFTPEYEADSIYHIGCFDSAFRDIQVTDITARFGKQKGVQCNAFMFYDSSGGVQRKWTFSVSGKELGQSDAQNPSFDFKTEKGIATVCLEATDSLGCTNVFCDTVQLQDNAFELIMPNVFTPGVDGKNDVFDILIKNYAFYKLSIYNRWGEIVYESHTDGIGNDLINWNGNYMNGPNPLPEGAYFYILETKELCDPGAESKQISGTITLIREN